MTGMSGRPPKATPQDIIRIAWQCFEEVGFEATTMTDIARRTGVSRRTLFNHFPHKAALLFPPATDYFTLLRDAFAQAPAHLPPLAALTEAVRRLGPVSVELETAMAPGAEVRAARYRDDAIEYWRGVWADGMERMALEAIVGPAHPVKARLAGAIAAQLWTEVSLLMRDAQPPLRLDAAIEFALAELTDLLTFGTGIPNAGR